MMDPIVRVHRAESRIAGSATNRPGYTNVLWPVVEQLGLISGLALAATAPVWVGSEVVFRLVDVLLSPWLD